MIGTRKQQLKWHARKQSILTDHEKKAEYQNNLTLLHTTGGRRYGVV